MSDDPRTFETTTERPCYACTPIAERVTPDGTRPVPLCPHHGSLFEVGEAMGALKKQEADPPCGQFVLAHKEGAPVSYVEPVFDPATIRVCTLPRTPFHTDHLDQHGKSWSTADTDDDED